MLMKRCVTIASISYFSPAVSNCERWNITDDFVVINHNIQGILN